jgi:predicted RNA-binding Zn ribbon-like protein
MTPSDAKTGLKAPWWPAPADDLCLEFANTRYWRGSAEPTETLSDLADVLRWAETACAGRVRTGDLSLPAGAFDEVIALREVVFRLFADLAGGRAIAPADLGALNAALAVAPRRERLLFAPVERGWMIPPGPPSVPALLAPVLWSAGDLLLGPRAARVRQCANPACQFLFLDDSKSGNRRWCSMSSCGNRAKAHRHYLKQKATR